MVGLGGAGGGGVPMPVSMISCGLFEDSRLARLIPVALGVVRPKVKEPSPVTYAVTSTVDQVFAVTAPDIPT